MSGTVSPGGVRARRPVTPGPGSPWLAAVLDVALVLVFAGVGRRSHAEAVLVGLAHTAWPFLAGLLLGWLVVLAARRRAPVAPRDGVVVWVAAVAGGMVLRAVTGAGVAVSFVVVASVVLGVFLLGWRIVVAVVAARRGRERPA